MVRVSKIAHGKISMARGIHWCPNFFYFFCPTSVSMLWRTRGYIHISNCLETVCDSCYQITLRVTYFFYKNRELCEGLTGYLSLGRRCGGNWANTWHWTKSITVPAMIRCPNENQMSIPFPVEGKLRCFWKGRWTDCTESFCSHLCCFVSEQLVPPDKTLIVGTNKCLHTVVKTSR
jgi:hypothetical protein